MKKHIFILPLIVYATTFQFSSCQNPSSNCSLEYHHDIEIDTTIIHINGIVTNENGKRLSGVKVTCSNKFGGFTTKTGASGEFTFIDLNCGYYDFTATKKGYCTVDRDTLFFNAGALIEMKIRLSSE